MGQRVARECVRELFKQQRTGATVTILGMTFKEDVPDTRNSKVVDIVRELRSAAVDVQVHDPIAAPAEAQYEHGIKLMPLDALRPADAVILAVAHHYYLRAGWRLVTELLKEGKGIVLDIKSRLDRAHKPTGITLWRL